MQPGLWPSIDRVIAAARASTVVDGDTVNADTVDADASVPHGYGQMCTELLGESFGNVEPRTTEFPADRGDRIGLPACAKSKARVRATPVAEDALITASRTVTQERRKPLVADEGGRDRFLRGEAWIAVFFDRDWWSRCEVRGMGSRLIRHGTEQDIRSDLTVGFRNRQGMVRGDNAVESTAKTAKDLAFGELRHRL